MLLSHLIPETKLLQAAGKVINVNAKEKDMICWLEAGRGKFSIKFSYRVACGWRRTLIGRVRSGFGR